MRTPPPQADHAVSAGASACARFIAQTEASTGAELPRFVKDDFDAFLERGILAHGFLRLRGVDCDHDKQLAFNCKRRGFGPSCGAWRMTQTAPHLVDHVMPHVPVRQWVFPKGIQGP
ncbi:transposase zinc-binding domain-containing protein [Ideonella sp. A 288]|uniref:transposase zinc-binding domain-containing protein n=1 Tax=Ideonella sp. A 288 TaxID=1962181 RepID=UPI000B4ABF95|nr:transposase zinc-binding domain-containing protein [Ideonella sp. A 288]